METENDFENQLGWELSLSEMKRRLQGVFNRVDETKKTFRSILSAASLIVALLGALQIYSSQVEPGYEVHYYVLLGSALFLYLILIIGCIWMLKPLDIVGPIPEDWDLLYKHLASKKEDIEIYKQLVSNYIGAIDDSNAIIEKRYRWSSWFLYLLPIIVTLLLVIGFLPRVP